MPNLCFRRRPRGRVVQLVRHVYDPGLKRGRTITVGSLDWHADPYELPYGTRLSAGQALDDCDLDAIRHWLRAHGDPEAATRRASRLQRLREEERAKVLAECVTGTDGSALRKAVVALKTARAAFPGLAAGSGGPDGKRSLRQEYLRVREAWEALVKVAQREGIAKVYRRRKKS